MKSDEDVRMISAEAPVLFARVRAHPLGVKALPLLRSGAGAAVRGPGC